MRVGDIVRIKSLTEIHNEGRIANSYTIPNYAASRMQEYFGDGYCYPVVRIQATSMGDYLPSGRAISVRTTNGVWTYNEADLEVIEELSYHMEVKVGHKYKLTNDVRLRKIFERMVGDWDYAGEVVEYPGAETNPTMSNDHTTIFRMDLPHYGYTDWNIPEYLLVEDLGPIENFQEGRLRMRCIKCGERYFVTQEEAEAMWPEDVNLCPHCRERKFVAPYHRYEPHLEFRNTAHDENPNLYLGVELEIGRGGELDENAEIAMNVMNNEKGKFIYCSHDSSINDGFEIITYPGTIEYHKSRKSDYEALFNKMRSLGYRSHDERTCGLHVHFSRAYYNEDGKETMNTIKLIYLIKKFWPEIVLFSRKDSDSIRRYAREIDDQEKSYYDRWNRCEEHEGHYFALNITNHNTIEFRIFRGTLNLKTYMLTLQMVYNLVTGAKNHLLAELSNMKFEDFLDDDGKEYFKIRKEMKGFGMTEAGESEVI